MSGIPWTSRAAFAAALVTLGTAGCRSSTGSAASGSTLTAVGFVETLGGAPLEGVEVIAGTKSTATDAGGRFQLDLGEISSVVLRFETDGYAPSYRHVQGQGAALVTVAAVLVPTSVETELTPSEGGVVDLGPGVSITVPAGALVDAAGAVPDGPAEVEATWISPEDALLGTPFPMQALDGGEPTALRTFGMVDVQATFQGEPLHVKSGTTIRLSAPALAEDPESAGLFFGDPATGTWKLEGSASRVGGEWVADLPHLSWWNVDAFQKVPFQKRACVDFVAKSPTGKGLPGVEIKSAWGPNNAYTIAGGTDAGGHLCHESFPGGDTLLIRWKAMLQAGSQSLVEGNFTITPSAYGAKCGKPECELVPIPIECTAGGHCSSGSTCEAGECKAAGGPGPDAAGDPGGGGGDGGDEPCVPSCLPNQCSDDGCGKPCMECPAGQTCNGLTEQCEDCVADCSGQSCGSDGCNGSCGLCTAGLGCDGASCVGACTFCPGGGCNQHGFEDGLPGWDLSGDVAVVPQMGPAVPPEGDRMLRLSTGLAYAAPSWAQKALCADSGVTTLRFAWRLFSEEFTEYCGSSYQDTFVVSILKSDGSRTELAKWTIDELCPEGENGCSTCGSKSPGISETDLSFDFGDVWATPWQTSTLALPAGGATATVVFEVADVGDSSYDTVVLLDDVTLLP